MKITRGCSAVSALINAPDTPSKKHVAVTTNKG
jgi:hypothetical protein